MSSLFSFRAANVDLDFATVSPSATEEAWQPLLSGSGDWEGGSKSTDGSTRGCYESANAMRGP